MLALAARSGGGQQRLERVEVRHVSIGKSRLVHMRLTDSIVLTPAPYQPRNKIAVTLIEIDGGKQRFHFRRSICRLVLQRELKVR